MATLHVQNVPDDLYKRLQQLAASQHRSISTQVITLLEQALPLQIPQPQENRRQDVPEMLDEIRRRREQRPANIEWPDSTALIREDRDR
jgi:plasmid stability protein